MLAPIHENGAKRVGTAFIKDYYAVTKLDELKRIRSAGVARNARWQAVAFRVVFG